MAALTLQAVINADRSITVTRSTADAIGSATAALVIDNTAEKTDVNAAIAALQSAVRRQFGKVSSPAGVPTTGTSVE